MSCNKVRALIGIPVVVIGCMIAVVLAIRGPVPAEADCIDRGHGWRAFGDMGGAGFSA